jgi:hypothetical protein
VNVVRASGGTVTTQSTASQALYGIRTFAQTDNLGISPARSSAMASEIYGQFGSPDYVLTSLDLQLEAMAGTAQARVQAIDLYDPARVIFRPSSSGSNIDKKYTIISIKQQFDGMIKSIQSDFPGWADNRSSSQKDFWGVTVPAIQEIANDPKWRQYADGKSDKWTEIAYWLTQANAFREQYTAAMNSDRRKADLKAQFSQFHYNFMQVASDEFSTFAARWLENMPELSTELVAS